MAVTDRQKIAASLKGIASAAKPILLSLALIVGGALGAVVGAVFGGSPGSTGIGILAGLAVGAGFGALLGNIAFVVLSSLAILILDHDRGESAEILSK